MSLVMYFHTILLVLSELFKYGNSGSSVPEILIICDNLLPLAEKAMAPHSSTLAWKTPWTEEPSRLQSMGSLRVGPDWAPSLSLFTFMHWRRKWQPTPVFLPGESQGWRSLVGCRLWGHRVRHDWSDLAAAATAAPLSFPLISVWILLARWRACLNDATFLTISFLLRNC